MKLLFKLMDMFPIPMQLWDADGRVIKTHQMFNSMLGLEPEFDWSERGLAFHSDPQVVAAGLSTAFKDALSGKDCDIASFTYTPQLNPDVNRPAEPVQLHMTVRRMPLEITDGRPCTICLVIEYVTIGGRYEEDLMRSQKMENVATLAGSVAHEFNNIFTGIHGLADLIKVSVDQQSDLYSLAVDIQTNIGRGADLINKLNSFAREMPHSLRRHKVSSFLDHSISILRMQAQKRIEIELQVNADAEVMLDSSRMEQALANVVNNSRDAMGGSGKILILVDRCGPPDAACALPSGEGYVRIEISDSGPGIAAEVIGKAIQPFFSTKERGKSTGLGLSVTNRIIEVHGGSMQLGNNDELGGAAIRIYLPVCSAFVQPVAEASDA